MHRIGNGCLWDSSKFSVRGKYPKEQKLLGSRAFINPQSDYELKSVTRAIPRISISFFDTEDAHTVVLALGADRAGELPLRDLPVLHLWLSVRGRAPAWIIGNKQAQTRLLFSVQKKTSISCGAKGISVILNNVFVSGPY